MNKVLIIGAAGSLGAQLMKDFCEDSEVIAAGTYHAHRKDDLIHLDMTQEEEVSKVLKKESPNIVIIAAAKTNVEACELEPEETRRVNILGTENIVNNCKEQKIVFYSTDNVFDGKKRLYKEDDIPNPLNFYGKSKLEGENIVRQKPDHLICRSSRFYGLEKECLKYINKIINFLRDGKEIKAPIDSEGNFTFIPDISRATIDLIKKNKRGTYHVAGADIYSLYDSALKVAEIFGFNKELIIPVDKDYFNDRVKRPSCALDISKLEREGIKVRSLEEGLLKIKERYK